MELAEGVGRGWGGPHHWRVGLGMADFEFRCDFGRVALELIRLHEEEAVDGLLLRLLVVALACLPALIVSLLEHHLNPEVDDSDHTLHLMQNAVETNDVRIRAAIRRCGGRLSLDEAIIASQYLLYLLVLLHLVFLYVVPRGFVVFQQELKELSALFLQVRLVISRCLLSRWRELVMA